MSDAPGKQLKFLPGSRRDHRIDQMDPPGFVPPPKGKSACRDCLKDTDRKQMEFGRCSTCHGAFEARIKEQQDRIEEAANAMIARGDAYRDHQGFVVEIKP